MRSRGFHKKPTYVCNTRVDDRWSDAKSIADKYKIAACWSQPIFNKNNQVIGSFALSSFEKRAPNDFQKNLLRVCSNLVSIILNKQEQENKLWEIAHHDALTGLPNRHFIDTKIKTAIQYSQENNTPFALMFIDMDNFKDINDSYGHSFGDKVILHSMSIIKSCLREGDIIARHGGDEFLLILENINNHLTIESIGQKILSQFRAPILIGNQKIIVHFSIGISLYPNDGLTSAELMKNADIAMYQAKAAGKNALHYFEKSLGEKIIRRMLLEQEMREALANDEFELYYQPQYIGDSNQIQSLEVLTRWNHPTKGFILPDEFIPIAEKSRLIIELSQAIFEKACLQGSEWISRGYDLPKLSLNLSTAQLTPGFSTWLISLINQTKFLAEHIELEITETLLMKHAEEDIEELNKIRDAGISLAMDDFGTGYSSLSQLKNLPIDKLKIDRSFVQNIEKDENDQTMIKTIITMGKNLGMKIVAEGVETKKQQKILLDHSCDMIQGFYRQRPVNAQQIEKILDKNDGLCLLCKNDRSHGIVSSQIVNIG